MTAERLMLAGGVSAFLLTVYWVRKRELRERYALGWLSVALLLLTIGVCPGILKGMAEYSRLSFTAAAFFLALTTTYFLAFSITVSLSRSHGRNLRLTQELALLELRVRELEKQDGGLPPPVRGRHVGRREGA